MTSRPPLPVGVIGVGSLGYHHARLLRGIQGVRLVGVHDLRPERCDAVAAEFGVRSFASADELLQTVEAVVVAVPTSAHAEVAIPALERGVHALIEKPIAPTLQEADRILAAAARSGALVAIGHVERYNGAVRACESYVEEPRFVESHRLAPFGPRGLDVAVVLDLMIHDIDLILSLVQKPVRDVDAVGLAVLTPNVDISNARVWFEEGAVANITASRISRERMRKVRFFQPSGYVSLDLAAGTGEFLRLRPGVTLAALQSLEGGLEGAVERLTFAGDGKEPLLAELESFVAAVRGESGLIVSGEEGRLALDVALRIVEKAGMNVPDPSPA